MRGTSHASQKPQDPDQHKEIPEKINKRKANV